MAVPRTNHTLTCRCIRITGARVGCVASNSGKACLTKETPPLLLPSKEDNCLFVRKPGTVSFCDAAQPKRERERDWGAFAKQSAKQTGSFTLWQCDRNRCGRQSRCHRANISFLQSRRRTIFFLSPNFSVFLKRKGKAKEPTLRTALHGCAPCTRPLQR